MPFLRVIRDRRGYETTYLLHWYRDGLRQRSRVLYLFRSPGGVRVGRDPLDPAILQQIEAQHPDIEFDWSAMREHRQVIETAPEPRRRRPSPEEPAAPLEPVRTVAAGDHVEQAPAEAPVASPAVPAAIEGGTPAEQITFLEKWHPLILERILRRTTDPDRQQALLSLADRLNPEPWTDADQITTGLQQAADALERLSRVFARRRRRARRRTPAAGSTPDDSPDREPAPE